MKRTFVLVLGVAALLVGLRTHAHGTTLRMQAVPSPAELEARGLPPAPNVPYFSDAYQTWLRVIRAAQTPVGVDFVPMPSQPHRVWQPDWAGPVLFAPGEKPLKIPEHRFAEIEGEWTVPFVLPTINCANKWEQEDGSNVWIALDGWSATFIAHDKGSDGKWHAYPASDLLNAGAESDVACYGRGNPRGYRTSAFFWIEWAGVRNIPVTKQHRNLPLKAGDTIYVRIAADTSGPHAWQRATLWLVNVTQRYFVPPVKFDSGCLNCGNKYQEPATLFGNTAEWITEAIFYDAVKPSLPNTLADFGTVTLSDAVATDQDGIVYEPGNPGPAKPNIDWMTWDGTPLDQGGTLWACSYIDGPTTTSFVRAPYVVATPGQQGDLEPKPKHC